MKVSIVGGSGYTGGELIRILLSHPGVTLQDVTSEQFSGKPVYKAHPNLRRATDLKFSRREELRDCDILFLATPHGVSMNHINEFFEVGTRIIDLSADFRLKNPDLYKEFYECEHKCPELLEEAVYGLAELHRDEIREARLVACGGCTATSAILPLAPLVKEDLVERNFVIVDSKVGSSASGKDVSLSTHHPERANVIRAYAPSTHRHVAEMEQELAFGKDIRVSFSAHAVGIVRGILSTCHVFLKEEKTEKDIWGVYRNFYGNEPFIRIVNEKTGIYRYPEPKILIGTNYCDIGFAIDEKNNRLVVISAIDNLVKGAAGQAVQAMNIMCNFEETKGLGFPGLHPI